MITSSLYISAFLLGSIHAIEPGHGKSAMAATILGSKDPVKESISMGAGTAIGHTIGLFIFAQIAFISTHSITEGFMRELMEISVGSVLILAGIISFTRVKISTAQSHMGCSCCNSKKRPAASKKSLKTPILGLLIGLIPCPSVIALALASSQFAEAKYLLILSLTFGFGVALTLTTLGLIFALCAHKLSSISIYRKLEPVFPYISPAVFIIFGISVFLHFLHGH